MSLRVQYIDVPDYTQVAEDNLVASMSASGFNLSMILWNTTIDKGRYWDGAAFQSLPNISANHLSLASATAQGAIPSYSTNSLKYLRVNAAGSATITITNVTTASITSATPLRFTIIKGVTA